MKRLQNTPATLHAFDWQAGWCDYNFPTEYTAAFRLCSREEIQLAFLFVCILGITAVAWQTTQHRATGGWKGSVLCHSIFLSQVHVSPFINQNSRPIHQKTRQNSPYKREKVWRERLFHTANYKLSHFSHKCSLSSPKALARTILTLGKLNYQRQQIEIEVSLMPKAKVGKLIQ